MDFKGIMIVCPACKADLVVQEEGASLRCTACTAQYPVVCGVPDLRVFPDPYMDTETDHAKARKLVASTADLGFAAALDAYYDQAVEVLPDQARQFKAGALAASFRAEAAWQRWQREADGEEPVNCLLEIGCGTAPLLAAAKRGYHRAVGVDIALRWLIIARKRLLEAGCDVPLICACAEALPFPDEQFDRIVLDAVVEHVQDNRKALAESFRVAKAGSYVFVATPNRFSLGPDPHVGIWAGGWLPKPIIDGYIRRRGGNPPRRKLLSVRSMRRLLRHAGFANPTVYLPDIPAGQRNHFSREKRMLIDTYQFVKDLRFVKQVLYGIGPLLHAVARKPLGKHVAWPVVKGRGSRSGS